MSSKEQIIEAVRAFAKDRDLDPQSRYDMLGEIGVVLDAESDTLYDENDLEDGDEWEPVDEDEDDFDDEFDDDFEDDEDDEFDDEDEEAGFYL